MRYLDMLRKRTMLTDADVRTDMWTDWHEDNISLSNRPSGNMVVTIFYQVFTIEHTFTNMCVALTHISSVHKLFIMVLCMCVFAWVITVNYGWQSNIRINFRITISKMYITSLLSCALHLHVVFSVKALQVSSSNGWVWFLYFNIVVITFISV